MSDQGSVTRRSTWKTVLRAVLSLVAVSALAYWFLISLFLFAFRCDDVCSGDQAHDPIYTIQFVVTLLGLGLGVSGLALGFTARWTRSWLLVLGAVGCFLAWSSLVMSGSL